MQRSHGNNLTSTDEAKLTKDGGSVGTLWQIPKATKASADRQAIRALRLAIA